MATGHAGRAGGSRSRALLEERIKGEEAAPIQTAMKELEAASMELGKAVYEAASKQAGGTDGPATGGEAGDGAQGGKSGGDDVIDAEYEVKDDKKS